LRPAINGPDMTKLLKAVFDYFLGAPDPAMLRRQDIYARQQRWLQYLAERGK
jgi:hypothetical protein